MSYATTADVATLLARELTTEDEALAERRLDQVERLIYRKIPDLDAQITAGDISVEDVTDIEAEAVYRVMRNPEGVRSETDGGYSYQLASEVADNSLRVLPEEWERLGIRPRRMFTISPRLGL